MLKLQRSMFWFITLLTLNQICTCKLRRPKLWFCDVETCSRPKWNVIDPPRAISGGVQTSSIPLSRHPPPAKAGGCHANSHRAIRDLVKISHNPWRGNLNASCVRTLQHSRRLSRIRPRFILVRANIIFHTIKSTPEALPSYVCSRSPALRSQSADGALRITTRRPWRGFTPVRRHSAAIFLFVRVKFPPLSCHAVSVCFLFKIQLFGTLHFSYVT